MFKIVTGIMAGLVGLTASAAAQNYPTRSVSMIIPFAAGGPTDILGRIVGARMSELLGQQVVIENVGGAGGMTGSKRVADAQPDGYVMGIGTVGTHAQGQTLDTPWVRERLEKLGLEVPEPAQRTPEYLTGFLESEIKKWAAPIKASGVSVE